MLDIASLGNGLVGPGRDVNSPPGGRLVTGSPSRPDSLPGERLGGLSKQTIDRVEVSEHADLMTRLERVPEVRWDRIEAVREAIGQDDYIDRRLDLAIDQLLSDI